MRDDEGQTPLDKALSLDNMYRNKGCFDVALYLINCGCGGEDEKSKLLCGASQRGKLDVVIGLVEQLDVDPNSKWKVNNVNKITHVCSDRTRTSKIGL